jgi:hypothetical protein
MWGGLLSSLTTSVAAPATAKPGPSDGGAASRTSAAWAGLMSRLQPVNTASPQPEVTTSTATPAVRVCLLAGPARAHV